MTPFEIARSITRGHIQKEEPQQRIDFGVHHKREEVKVGNQYIQQPNRMLLRMIIILWTKKHQRTFCHTVHIPCFPAHMPYHIHRDGVARFYSSSRGGGVHCFMQQDCSSKARPAAIQTQTQTQNAIAVVQQRRCLPMLTKFLVPPTPAPLPPPPSPRPHLSKE